MLENEFEKKVQQKMEEFRLRPSDDVWGRVEDELKRKKKRRIVLFIFLLVGISLLSSTGYFILNHSKQSIVEQNSTPSQKQPSPGDKAKDLPAPVRNATTDPSGKSQPSIKESNKINEAPHPPVNRVTQEKSGINEATKDRHIAKEPAGSARQDRKTLSPESDKTLRSRETENAETILLEEVKRMPNNTLSRGRNLQAPQKDKDDLIKSGIEKKVDQQDLITKTTGVPDRVSEKINPAPGKVDNNSPANKDENIVAPQPLTKDTALPAIAYDVAKQNIASPPKRSSNINWGIDFSIGVSDGRKSALPFSNGQNKAMDSYNYYTPTQGFPGGAAYFPPIPPSPVNPGLGFKIGPVGEMTLSKRSRLSFGLDYVYMSTSMMIGSYTNTALVINNSVSQSLRVEAVYQGTYQKEYTNHYHFIEAPVTYHLQLNKGKKLPINWNIGASAGYLVETNGLFYDTAAGGIYYRDMKAYNRLQFNLHSGFSVRFGSNKRLQWSVGPELSMNMNKLVNDQYTKKQYLIYGGLTGRLIFSKKK